MSKYLKRVLNTLKYGNPKTYVPAFFEKPKNSLDIVSAWKGHDLVLLDIIKKFNLPTKKCLEFGVEFGFSTVAMSSYFDEVIGVDIFTGDIHTSHKGDHFAETKERLAPYSNIKLYKADYQDYIKNNSDYYDLIHVDIVHTFDHTFKCGLWSAQHSKCTIFHDTDSFPEVRKAVFEIAKATKKQFYNYPKHFGLGIIV